MGWCVGSGVGLDWDRRWGAMEIGGDREDGVKLGLGDCVWCVLLPEPVANATISSKTTPPVSHN